MNWCKYVFAGAVMVVSSACEKEDRPELSLLPPATQVGANTFGCLLNGKAYIPYGGDGNRGGPFQIAYEPSFRKGELTVSAFRYTTKSDTWQSILLSLDSVQATGRYALHLPRRQEALFNDEQTGCAFHLGEPHYRAGELIITRLNKQRGIIAGTFHFKLYRPGCDSVIVTEGRFDYQL